MAYKLICIFIFLQMKPTFMHKAPGEHYILSDSFKKAKNPHVFTLLLISKLK